MELDQQVSVEIYLKYTCIYNYVTLQMYVFHFSEETELCNPDNTENESTLQLQLLTCTNMYDLKTTFIKEG